MKHVPTILVTPGEPAGIGPDLLIQLAQDAWPAQLVAIADPALLAARAAQLKLPLEIRAPGTPHAPRTLAVDPLPLATVCTPGKLDPRNAPAVLEALRRAVKKIQGGEANALVTGPVQKSVINDAGIAFTGHTEFLAELSGAAQPVMLLASGALRVALATTHLPLAAVPAALTAAKLEQTLRVLHAGLRARFGIAQPRILVAGLNPHAGEDGHLGREEIEVIAPVLKKLCAEGMNLEGPLPADTLFLPEKLAQPDAVLAMYHDQGLPVLKHVGFRDAVNVTLGLPFLRTSVDHGTALELAGTGKASAESFRAALKLAIERSR